MSEHSEKSEATCRHQDYNMGLFLILIVRFEIAKEQLGLLYVLGTKHYVVKPLFQP